MIVVWSVHLKMLKKCTRTLSTTPPWIEDKIHYYEHVRWAVALAWGQKRLHQY